MKKVLLLLVMLVMLIGCTTAPKETPEDTLTLQEGKLIVGMEANYAPFNWTQITANEFTVAISSVDYADGYDVQMARIIADALGLELVVKKLAWEGLIPALNANEIDLVIAGMTETPDRAASADFTSPYYESDMVMIVRADDDLVNATSIQDFANKVVMGQMNTTYDEIIDQINDVIHAVPQESYPRMVLSLLSNEVDGLTAELPVAVGVVAANPSLAIVRFSAGNGFEVDTSVSVAVKKGNQALRDAVQAVLDTIDQDVRDQMMIDATNRQPAVE
ncbi:MAG: transporter substrate-binding domain-containing protein [Erysipelotrichaceae bacterium]|nr:transporter substrate-binding domain-containing protein [Erysipelotrichaceae bacterium]